MKKEILRFTPWLRPMIWGGDKISAYKGLEHREGIGESWEISAVPEHSTIVKGGEYDGKNLKDLLRKYKGELVGKHVYEKFGDIFPLLIKFIDAKSDLSIQVHPNDEMAQERHKQPFGKTEMWYVVGADEGAYLYSGMKNEITSTEYEQLVENHTITDVLAKHNIQKGDVFYLPAGRVHAIGAGSFIAEIQQTSDLTYRIYDYGRKGLDGNPRELHTELAKETIDYKVYSSYKQDYDVKAIGRVPLVSCEYFTTHKLRLEGERFVVPMTSLDSFFIIICTEGKGMVNNQIIQQGETVLLPSVMEEAVIEGNLTVLTTYC